MNEKKSINKEEQYRGVSTLPIEKKSIVVKWVYKTKYVHNGKLINLNNDWWQRATNRI